MAGRAAEKSVRVLVRGDRYPQWFLLLVAVLGPERLPRRRGWSSSAGHRTPPFSICTAVRKPGGYNKAHLQEFGEVLQAWMTSQIPGGQKI